MLYEENIKKFHQEAVSALYKDDLVRLFRLTFNKEPIALLYMLKRDETYYYYISGFSIKFKKYSPGSLILYKIIEHAFKEQIKKIDFLKGAEEYKYKFGAADTYVYFFSLKKSGRS